MKVEDKYNSALYYGTRTCHRFTYDDGTVLSVYDGGEYGYGKDRHVNVFLNGGLVTLRNGASLIVSKGPLFSKGV